MCFIFYSENSQIPQILIQTNIFNSLVSSVNNPLLIVESRLEKVNLFIMQSVNNTMFLGKLPITLDVIH